MKGKVKLSNRIIALIVAGAFVATIGFTLLGFFIAYWVSDKKAIIWHPDYEMLSEDELRECFDNNDYDTLFKQTGLTKAGIERAKNDINGWARVKSIQHSYFLKRSVAAVEYMPLICTDFIDGESASMIYLQRGDILVTSSTHFSGFRIGHSAIVTDGEGGIVFQSNQVGELNGYDTASAMFAVRTNFMVLRIKPEYFSDNGVEDQSYYNNLDRATEYIETNFAKVPYRAVTGVFTKKDSMRSTSCAHLIWYGFKHFDDERGGRFNLDLDSNGRLLVMPKDIAESPYVELVQNFGFNPDKMYE